MPPILFDRQFYVALVAIAAGAGALVMLRDEPWGTLRATGPALMPGVIAIALLLTGLWHMLRTVLWPSAQRHAREGYAWLDLLPWAVLAALVLSAAAMRQQPPAFLLYMGPAEIAAAWLLLLSIVFAASWIAERGALCRLAIPILLGALCAVGGTDISTGAVRFWDDDPTFLHGVLAGALVVALRLPVVSFVIPCTVVFQLEEQIRRSLVISRGDPLIFVTRPWSAALVSVAVVILTAVLVHRFMGRRRR